MGEGAETKANSSLNIITHTSLARPGNASFFQPVTNPQSKRSLAMHKASQVESSSI